MKKKQKKAVMGKKESDLVSLLGKQQQELQQAQLRQSEEKNTNSIRNLKRSIALTKTVLHMKRRAQIGAGAQ
jgi:ribosomal protein L29